MGEADLRRAFKRQAPSDTGNDHVAYLFRLLKVVKLMRFDPPLRGFHEQIRVVILVGKERIEGQTYAIPLFGYLLVANRHRLSPK